MKNGCPQCERLKKYNLICRVHNPAKDAPPLVRKWEEPSFTRDLRIE